MRNEKQPNRQQIRCLFFVQKIVWQKSRAYTVKKLGVDREGRELNYLAQNALENPNLTNVFICSNIPMKHTMKTYV